MNNYTGKKLLILAGAAVHCKVVEAAKRMGIYTIVTDYLETSPAKELADEAWMLNITDVDGIVERCRKENVDGVLNFCIDPAQRPYQQICEKLNIPCYGNKEQFYIMTDKPSFKAFCQKVGVDIIPEYSIEAVRNGEVEYPVFVKPTDSRGSRGQAVCWTKESALEAIEVACKESSDGNCVIEKFMADKQDFSMTYFVCNGEPYLIRTCDRYLGRIEDKLNKQCVGCIAPSKYSEFYLEKVHEKACQFIKELGITYGPVFMQGFVDEETIRFYDPGLRFPGGEYERLLMEATGVDLMSLLVEFALTGTIKDVSSLNDGLWKLNRRYTIQLPITARPGKIAKLNGLEEISRNPAVTTAFKRYEVGEVVPESGDVRQRVCEVALVIKQEESVKEAVEWVQSKLEVLDEQNENMLVSLVDPEVLKY